MTKIEFFQNGEEKILPMITLTKSKNGKTGTATFFFLKPTVFEKISLIHKPQQKKKLVWKKKRIKTKDISIFIYKGEPLLLKSTFLFKNAFEWFDFFQFMKMYSQKTGLVFEEKKIP